MTGADSPVIADSSTLATPSTMSPSPGIDLAGATTTTRSPEPQLRWPAPPRRGRRRASRRADWSRSWLRRRVAACALPRPSATASARLAKTTVSQSQTTTARRRRSESSDGRDGGEHGADLDDEHHRVAHHHARVELAHGVRQRGEQHLRVEQAAGPRGGSGVVMVTEPSASGPRARTGKKVRPGDDQRDADEHGRRRAGRGSAACPRSGGHLLLAAERPRQGEHEDHRHEPTEQHRQRRGRCCRRCVFADQTGERGAVVVAGGHEGVEHLGETVRARR